MTRYSIRWYIGQKNGSQKWEIDQINDKTRIGAEIGIVYDHYDCNRMLHTVIYAHNEHEALGMSMKMFNDTLKARKWRNDLGQI